MRPVCEDCCVRCEGSNSSLDLQQSDLRPIKFIFLPNVYAVLQLATLGTQCVVRYVINLCWPDVIVVRTVSSVDDAGCACLVTAT